MAGFFYLRARVEYLAVIRVGYYADIPWWCGETAHVKIEEEGRQYPPLRYSLSDHSVPTFTVAEDRILLSSSEVATEEFYECVRQLELQDILQEDLVIDGVKSAREVQGHQDGAMGRLPSVEPTGDVMTDLLQRCDC